MCNTVPQALVDTCREVFKFLKHTYNIETILAQLDFNPQHDECEVDDPNRSKHLYLALSGLSRSKWHGLHDFCRTGWEGDQQQEHSHSTHSSSILNFAQLQMLSLTLYVRGHSYDDNVFQVVVRLGDFDGLKQYQKEEGTHLPQVQQDLQEIMFAYFCTMRRCFAPFVFLAALKWYCKKILLYCPACAESLGAWVSDCQLLKAGVQCHGSFGIT